MHIHVASSTGEAKFWLEPVIELARNHGLTESEIRMVSQFIEEHEDGIRDAWHKHFGR
jgi:hypothetical protein